MPQGGTSLTVNALDVPADDADERFNHPSERWQRRPDRTYAAFIEHAPVVVALTMALRDWEAPPLVKVLGVAVAEAVL